MGVRRMSIFPICDLCKHNGSCYRQATGKVCKTIPKKYRDRAMKVFARQLSETEKGDKS